MLHTDLVGRLTCNNSRQPVSCGNSGQVEASRPLSDLARSYGAIYGVLRNDTDRVLLSLFRADPARVTAGREEWHDAQPESGREGGR